MPLIKSTDKKINSLIGAGKDRQGLFHYSFLITIVRPSQTIVKNERKTLSNKTVHKTVTFGY